MEGFNLVYGFGSDVELDLDLSAYHSFRIDVASYSGPTLTATFLFDSGNDRGGAEFLTIVDSDIPQSFYVPFVPFQRQNDVDFSDIDFINLQGGLAAGSEFVLGGIFAVPEPTSIGLAVSMMLVAIHARRQRIEDC